MNYIRAFFVLPEDRQPANMELFFSAVKDYISIHQMEDPNAKIVPVFPMARHCLEPGFDERLKRGQDAIRDGRASYMLGTEDIDVSKWITLDVELARMCGAIIRLPGDSQEADELIRQVSNLEGHRLILNFHSNQTYGSNLREARATMSGIIKVYKDNLSSHRAAVGSARGF